MPSSLPARLCALGRRDRRARKSRRARSRKAPRRLLAHERLTRSSTRLAACTVGGPRGSSPQLSAVVAGVSASVTLVGEG